MIRALIMFGLVIGSATVAEPINRAKMWTDAEVDAQARKWGEEAVREDGVLAQQEALAKWRENIMNCGQLPINSRIEFLSKALENISRFSNYQVSERIEVYDLARDKMVAIPGHTQYFTDKIEESWESNAESVRENKTKLPPDWQTELSELPKTRENGEAIRSFFSSMWRGYDEICSRNLGMLGHIPSTESVRALGNYLPSRDEPDFALQPPNAEFYAAMNLTGLIADGPMQTWRASYEDVSKWQQWFDDVKAGKRTFRFVGSDVDYTLDGPVDAGTRERIRKKDSSRQPSGGRREPVRASEEQGGPNKMGPALQGGWIAAILLCLGSLAFLIWRQASRIETG